MRRRSSLWVEKSLLTILVSWVEEIWVDKSQRATQDNQIVSF